MSTNKESGFEFIKKAGRKIGEAFQAGKKRLAERREEAKQKAHEKATEEVLEIISFIPGLERTIKEFKPLVEKLRKLRGKVDPSDKETLAKVDKAIQELEDTIEKLEEEKRAEYVQEFIDQFQITPDSGFESLNELQKFKVIQDLRKRVVDMVKTDAETQYSDYVKEVALGEDDSLAKDISVGLRKITMKNYDMQGVEQEVLTSLATDPEKKKLVIQDMELLTRKVGSKGPDGVTLNKDKNRVDVVYVRPEANDDIEVVKAYNDAVNDFVQIPYEWGLETDQTKKEKYLRAKDLYEAARSNLQAMRANLPGADELNVMVAINQLEKEAVLEQMLNTHPEADHAFENLGEDPSLKEWVKRFWQDKTTGKGLTNVGITGVGVVARKAVQGAAVATASTGLSLVAAPIIGGVIGRWRARVRARAEIEKGTKQARVGQESKRVQDAKAKLRKAEESKNKKKIEKAKADLELAKAEQPNMAKATDLASRLMLLTDRLENLDRDPDGFLDSTVEVGSIITIDDEKNPGKYKKYKVAGVDGSGNVSLIELKSKQTDPNYKTKVEKAQAVPGYPRNKSTKGKSEWLIANVDEFRTRIAYNARAHTPGMITLKEIEDYENMKVIVDEPLDPRQPPLEMDKTEILEKLRQDLVEQISRRIEYTEKKISEGLVTFAESEREAKLNAKHSLDELTMAQRKYMLIHSLNEALVSVASLQEQDKNAIDARLDAYLSKKETKIKEAQKDFVKRQGKRGAMMGAGFGTFGYVARWAGEEFGWWGGDTPEGESEDLGGKEESFNKNNITRDESYSSNTTVPEPIVESGVPEPIIDTEGTNPESGDVAHEQDTPQENIHSGNKARINESPNKEEATSKTKFANSDGSQPEARIASDGSIEAEDMDPKFIVDKGLGVTHAFKEQIKADPELGKALAKQIDYTGKIGTPAFYEALGKHFGYINEGGNQTDNIDEIRVKWGGEKGMAAYKFILDDDGKTYKVREYHLTEGKWQPKETHRMDEKFEGEDYERKYEYYKDHKGGGGGERIRKPVGEGGGPTKVVHEGGPTLKKIENDNPQFKIKEEVGQTQTEKVSEEEVIKEGPTRKAVKVNLKPKTGLTSGGYMTDGAYYTDGARAYRTSTDIFRVAEEFTPEQKADIAREMDALSGARRNLMEKMTRDVVRDMGPDKGTLTFYHDIALTGERAMNSDLNQIVNGEGSYMKSDFWRNVQGVNAKKFLEGKAGGTSGDDIQLREYVKNLMKYSRLEPKNNMFNHEDVGTFVRRAHSHLAVLAHQGKFNYYQLQVPGEPYVPSSNGGYQDNGGGYDFPKGGYSETKTGAGGYDLDEGKKSLDIGKMNASEFLTHVENGDFVGSPNDNLVTSMYEEYIKLFNASRIAPMSTIKAEKWSLGKLREEMERARAEMAKEN